jgi:hypothetical protein
VYDLIIIDECGLVCRHYRNPSPIEDKTTSGGRW